jgi:hypothetical protein
VRGLCGDAGVQLSPILALMKPASAERISEDAGPQARRDAHSARDRHITSASSRVMRMRAPAISSRVRCGAPRGPFISIVQLVPSWATTRYASEELVAVFGADADEFHYWIYERRRSDVTMAEWPIRSRRPADTAM